MMLLLIVNTPPVPAVSKVTPNTGTTPGGATVTITGTSFTNVLSVKFALGDATSFTVTSPTSITAVTPAHVEGTVDVTVTTTIGTSSAAAGDQFTYTTPPPPTPPSVTAVSPPSGPTAGGTTVTITGSKFTGATFVRFASLTAPSFSVLSDTTITAVSPSRAAGAVDVTVSDAYGTSAKSPGDLFTYVAPPLPTVFAITPSTGSTTGGTAITITGSNFTGVTAVRFARVAALSFAVISPTSITAVSPAHSAGAVDVTVVASGGTSAVSSSDLFTYSSKSRQVMA